MNAKDLFPRASGTLAKLQRDALTTFRSRDGSHRAVRFLNLLADHYLVRQEVERARQLTHLDPLHIRLFTRTLPSILDRIKETRQNFRPIVRGLERYGCFEALDDDLRTVRSIDFSRLGHSLEAALAASKVSPQTIKLLQETELINYQPSLRRVSTLGSKTSASLVDQFTWMFDVYRQELAGEGLLDGSELTNPGSAEVLIKIAGVVLGVLNVTQDAAQGTPISIANGLQLIADSFWTVWSSIPRSSTRRDKAQATLDEYFSSMRN